MDPGVRMVLVHDFPFDYNDAKEIPQMVTKDHHLDRTYICDLGISQIHTYEVQECVSRLFFTCKVDLPPNF